MDLLAEEITGSRADLLRAAGRRLRNHDWAEDAVSETLLAALERRPDFDEPGRLRAWLFGILRHKVVDQLRHHLGDKVVRALDDLEAHEHAGISAVCPRADPQRQAGDTQFMAALEHQLTRLPSLQARAFLMRECWGSDPAEICRALDISPGHLCVVLHRARRRLRLGLVQHR